MVSSARSAGLFIQRGRLAGLATALFVCLSLAGAGAETRSGHHFPRSAIFQWGGAPAEWYAKFDLVMTRGTDRAFIAQVKKINPNTLWLFARDFNKADELYPNKFHDQWFLRDSKGKKITLYGPDMYWADLSDLAPTVDGKRLIDDYPSGLARVLRDSGADGIATDGLYHRLHLEYRMFSDVDLDRNGLNDLTEAGKGKAWVIDHWAKGVDQFLASLRREVGNDKLIIVNTGSTDTPGLTLVNGYVAENTAGEYNWNFTRKFYAGVASKVMTPYIQLVNHTCDVGDPLRIRPAKDNFPFVRFGLGRTMLLDQYFECEDNDDHFWNKYYDELDLDLGYPTGPMQPLGPCGPNDQGVWARFFDQGAVLVNFSPKDVTVTAEQMSALTGWQGPYHRFRGGQDPKTNDGAPFNQVTLRGHAFGTAHVVSGDALLLVKKPMTVVSDIVIDNSDSGTSPASSAAVLSAGWAQKGSGAGSNCYTLRCAEYKQSYGFASTAAGTGSATATFRPFIGVAGNYEVFEWHGTLSNSGAITTEASNVPCVISYSGGSKTLTINQRVLAGQWNSLGVFAFAEGTSGNVTITNLADGHVIADAVKYAYRPKD